MAPTYLAGLVVDGIDHALAPDVIVRARPSVDAIGRRGEVKAPAGVGADNE
jgi:hypothetical protein